MVRHVAKTGIARFWRLGRQLAQMFQHGCGNFDPVLLEYRNCRCGGGRIWYGRTRCDNRRVVSRHIRNHQRNDRRGRRRDRQSPALDRRQVLADGIHFSDMRAAAQQCAIDRLLVLERDPGGGERQQRRTAAGKQTQHEIVRPEPLDPGENPPSRFAPSGVRHRVRRLDHLDMPARHGVAIAGDDEPLDRPRPVRLDSRRHRSGGLPGTDDDGPALGRLRQVLRNAQRRRGGPDGGIEHVAQQRSIIHARAGVACRSARVSTPIRGRLQRPGGTKQLFACSPRPDSRLPSRTATVSRGDGGMKRREKLSSIAAAMLFAALCSTTNALPVRAQESPAASAAVPQAGSFLLTVFLRHDQTKTVDQINEHLKQTGWYDKFPPDGVEIVAWYVMMGIGQVVILRVPAEKLRDTNRVIEQTAWGGYRTEFYATYDFKPVWDAIPHHRP